MPMASDEKPWRDDPLYGGMSDYAVERSWRTGQERAEREKHAKQQNGDADLVANAAAKSKKNKEINGGDVANSMQEKPKQRKPAALEFRAHRDRNVPTPRYLVKNLIPETGTGLLSGQASTYKSFIALKLAGAVATAKPFIMDHATKRQGAVLIFASEGAGDLPLRLEALSHGEHDGAKLPIYFVEHSIALLDELSLQDVIVTASAVHDTAMKDFELPLSLIVFDTLIGAAGFAKAGDENDAVVGAKLMAALDEISKVSHTFTIGIDHHGKSSEVGTRGSSAKEASADLVLSLLANRSASGEVTSARLCVRKSRGGPGGREFPFTVRSVDLGLDEDGELLSSLIVEFGTEATAPDDGKHWSTGIQTLRRILMTITADAGTDMAAFADGPIVRAVPASIVRDEYCKQTLAEGDAKTKKKLRQQEFRRAIKAAQNKGLIGIREVEIEDVQWIWLTRHP